MSNERVDCANGCGFSMLKGAGVVRGVSVRFGEYYSGDAICGACSSDLYTKFVENPGNIPLDKKEGV